MVRAVDPVNPYIDVLSVRLRQGSKSTSKLLANIHFSYGKNFRGIYLRPTFEANLIERTNSRQAKCPVAAIPPH